MTDRPAPRTDPATDAALAARCRAGDERAWAELYATYAPLMARFLARSAGGGVDAADLTQQVFVECFTTIQRFRGDSSLKTWLYGIASHVAYKARRTWFRTARRARAAAANAEPWGGAGAVALDDQVQARQELDQVALAIAALPTKLRLAWVLVELEGLSGREAAQALRVRESTARAHLCEARRRVLAAVGAECDEAAEPSLKALAASPHAGRPGG